MNNLLTTEDSKRVADAIIATLKNMDLQQIPLAIKQAVKESLGVTSSGYCPLTDKIPVAIRDGIKESHNNGK